MLHLIGALWVPWIWLGNPDGRIWIQRIISEPEFSASELADHPARVDALNIQAVLLAGTITSVAMSCLSKPRRSPSESAMIAAWLLSTSGAVSSASFQVRVLRRAYSLRLPSPAVRVLVCQMQSVGAMTTSAGLHSSMANMIWRESTSSRRSKWPAAILSVNGSSRMR
ncbi:MAG: hypothetical protein M3325_05440 [Actinomycetota bacterium]|nr:hypothetical protein [Actinomycetota bacterium]